MGAEKEISVSESSHLELLTIPEAAKRWPFGKSTFYLWCEQGICPVWRKPGSRTIRIPVAEFEEWLRKHVSGPTNGVLEK